MPFYSGSTVGWEGEISDAKDGTGTTSEIKFSPKRLTAFIDVSRQFLNQTSFDAETKLRNDLLDALSNKLEETILGKEVGSEIKPAGLFATAPAIKGTPTYKTIVDMEKALEDANVSGNKVFIVNPSAKSVLKTTEKSTGTAKYLMEGEEIDGYKVLATGNIAKGLQVAADEAGVVFGDFKNYTIAQWGGLEINVDTNTQSIYGKTRIVVNAYFDAKPTRTAAFVTASVK